MKIRFQQALLIEANLAYLSFILPYFLSIFKWITQVVLGQSVPAGKNFPPLQPLQFLPAGFGGRLRFGANQIFRQILFLTLRFQEVFVKYLWLQLFLYLKRNPD